MENQEKRAIDTYSWKFNSSLEESIMTDELLPSRKLNVFHFACIGIFLGLAGCSIAATVYAFAT